MPSKYPTSTPNEIIRALRKAGFSSVSQKGSHAKYSDGIDTVIIPMHNEIKRWTLKSILEQAGMTLDEFQELIK